MGLLVLIYLWEQARRRKFQDKKVARNRSPNSIRNPNSIMMRNPSSMRSPNPSSMRSPNPSSIRSPNPKFDEGSWFDEES